MLIRGTMAALAVAALPLAVQAQPVQGVYVGLGAGVYWPGNIDVTVPGGGTPSPRLDPSVGFGAVGSVGYGLGNGFRFEVEGNYRQASISHGRGPGTPSFSGSLRTYGVMANALYDLDIGVPWLYPYLGGGVGYAVTGLHNFVVTPAVMPPGVVRSDDSQGSLAWQGIVGLSFPMPNLPGLSLTAEYRFFGVTGGKTYAGTQTPPGAPFPNKLQHQYSSNFLFGVRYAFGVTPPPAPAAAPAAAPAPAVQPARSYLVFFDWDKATLTGRAKQIVKEAAENSTHVQYTRIEVNGYTDTSGTPRYNLALSQRRAAAVKAELIRDGVPANAITTQGFGETHLLVPTGPNVREPQNRRVEIIIR